MITRATSGWEVMLADLSLILFMVTAVALSQAGEGSKTAPVSPQGQALAFYRAEPDAPPLRQWLASQTADPRQELTIVAHYAPGGQAAALRQAEALASEAGKAGKVARIVVEPGEGGTTATLAFDAPDATLARNLQ